MNDKITECIECLQSCIADEEKRDTRYLDDYEKGLITGRIDGYLKAIEMLEYARNNL